MGKLLFQQIADRFVGGSRHRRRRRFSIWLVILWLAWFISGPALANSQSGNQPPNSDAVQNNRLVPQVSVRMSTSIVESANYQPSNELVQLDTTTTTSTTIPPPANRDQQYLEPNHQRGSRFFRSQDSFRARNDNPPTSTSIYRYQPLPPPLNSVELYHHQQQPAPTTTHSAGRIQESTPGGHRWSVSTSRTLSPAALQVLSQSATNQAPSGYGRDKTPSEHKHSTDVHNNHQQQRGLFRRILDGGQQTILDLRCEGRGVGKMLKSAKNMLQERVSSIEEHSGLLMFGSSLLAATIPLAVLYSTGSGLSELALPPNRRASQPPADGGDGPLSFVRHLSLQSRVDSMMGWIERSVEHLPSFPRLHPQECVKRSICEAHNEPTKYGAIGFILRLLFPATNLSSTDRMDNMEYKVINKYRHAAGYGLNRRIDSNGTNVSACKEKYEDCLISLLDVARNMMDVFLK